MGDYRFNKPYFELELSEVDDPVHVFSFDGEEEVSGLYEFRIKLLSENPALDASDILDKKATFIMYRGEDEEPVKIHGIISQFEQWGRTPEYVWYYAVLVPKMWRLKLSHQNVVFQDRDMKELIEDVFDASEITSNDYSIDVEEEYPKRNYIIQYRETDFDFLNRRLEHYGIFYYFDQQDDREVIVLGDSNAHFKKVEPDDDIRYNPNKDLLSYREGVTELVYNAKVVTGRVQLKDYDYEHPDRNLIAESQINNDAPGTYYEYGGNYSEQEEGDFLARIRNEEILCSSKQFRGKSDCRLFRAGCTFKLDKHFRDDWNREYVITRIAHRGNQKGLFGIFQDPGNVEPTYENSFIAIPEDLQFRPKRRTPVPRIQGIMTARVENGNGDQYADVDDQGRYRLKMPFDLRDTNNGRATKPVRLIQPYSGANYGIHFPNHENTEMVWACLDGDVDRPVGIGTVPNTNNASPAKSDNKAQSVIRTAGENELTFDDTEGKENIYLHATKDHNVKIKNDKVEEIGNDENRIINNNFSETIHNKSHREVKTRDELEVGIGGYKRKVKGNEEIEVFGSRNVTVHGEDNWIRKAPLSSIEYGVKHTTMLGAEYPYNASLKHEINIGGKWEINKAVKVGEHKRKEEKVKGPYTLDAKEKIELKSGHSKIVLKKDGTIEIIGKSIKIGNGTTNLVELEGKQVDLEAGQNLFLVSRGNIDMDGKFLDASSVQSIKFA